jgi:transcriptional regulator with XRE-family HTH domain
MADTPLTLRQARLQQRLSIATLARLTGVHRVTIWRYEHGRSHPLPVIQRSLALVLGTASERMAWERRQQGEPHAFPEP